MPHFPQFPAAHSFCPLTPTFLCLSSSLSVSWRMSICLVWRGSKEGVLTGWQDREGDKCSDLGLLLTQTSVRVRRREFEREKKGNQAKHRHLWALRQILHHLARTRSPLNQPRQVPKDLLQPSPAIPWFISLPWPIQHTLAPPALHGSRTITSKMQHKLITTYWDFSLLLYSTLSLPVGTPPLKVLSTWFLNIISETEDILLVFQLADGFHQLLQKRWDPSEAASVRGGRLSPAHLGSCHVYQPPS